MKKVQTIKRHQEVFLEKAKKRKTSVMSTVEGIEIIVNPGVFQPAPFVKTRND